MARKNNRNNSNDNNLFERMMKAYEISRQFSVLAEPSAADFVITYESINDLPYQNEKCHTLIFESYLFILTKLDEISENRRKQDEIDKKNDYDGDYDEDAELLAETEPVIRHDIYKALLYITKITLKNAPTSPENFDVIFAYLEKFIAEHTDEPEFKNYCSDKKLEPYVAEMLYLDIMKLDIANAQTPEVIKNKATWLLENSLYIDTRVELTNYLLEYGAKYHQLDATLPLDLVDIALSSIPETLAFDIKDDTNLTATQFNTQIKLYKYFKQDFDAILDPAKQIKPKKPPKNYLFKSDAEDSNNITDVTPHEPQEIVDRLKAQKKKLLIGGNTSVEKPTRDQFKENKGNYLDYIATLNYTQEDLNYGKFFRQDITYFIPQNLPNTLNTEEIVEKEKNYKRFLMN